MPAPTRNPDLERQLLELLVETHEQRRRVGQTLYHFYRTLVFWMSKERSFLDITKAWAASGAAVFDALALTLGELGPSRPDVRLRTFLAGVLEQLAGDLERGDRMLVPFLRWLETCFPDLTAMIREESAGAPVSDRELAVELSALFTLGAGADRAGLVARLREGALNLRSAT